MATTASTDITRDELQLAARNHGMPLEALRYDVTPTGLHYLLIHYDIPALDPATWRLRVDGVVDRPLEFTLHDLMERPQVTTAVTMECAGNGRTRLSPRAVSQPWIHEAVGTAQWTGTPLAGVLAEAGITDGALEVVLSGADRGVEGGVAQRYERSLRVADAMDEDVLLVHTMNGAPLPVQHGAPVRVLVPGWYGMTSVKWIVGLRVVSEPFDGYQMRRAYVYRRSAEDPGRPVERIAVRSLMIPPGVPDFLSRTRHLAPGPCLLGGRAWSGSGPITAVHVSTDGGATWSAAAVEDAPGPHAWQRWHADWDATPGTYELCCRATDAAGNVQPLTPDWNTGGYEVNAVHRVPVVVADAPS
jgi:sulfane dehydrogenase subunit SoxC